MAVRPRIDPDRMKRLLDGINGFGRDPATGGFNRLGYSPDDMAVRRWFADQMTADGLAVRVDAVANIFGRFGSPEGPAFLVGSHLDTVPQGGAFDGALGVVAALESVLAMQEAGVTPRVAIEVVATAEEEGRFGGMLGSQAMAGTAGADWVSHARAADGTRLADELRAQGLDPARADEARRDPTEIAGFIELHIEQGPVLERASLPVGLVTAISGCCVLQVTLGGVANHSGTTPMEMRADAFAGLAQVAAFIPDIIASRGTEQSRLTIGQVALTPNEAHTIPGKAEFSLVLRDTDEGVMRRLRDGFENALAGAAAEHGLSVRIEERSWLPPVELDTGLRGAARAAAGRLDLPFMEMPSGAGHDAQSMQVIAPAALIFVPSRGGISHAPEEHTDWGDAVAGAEVLLEMLLDLTG